MQARHRAHQRPRARGPGRVPRGVLAALVAGACLLVACDAGAEAPSATEVATTTVPGQTAPGEAAPGQMASPIPGAEHTPEGGPLSAEQRVPDVQRTMGHLRMLAEKIGVRPAGSEEERAAAVYIRDALADAGFDAAIEEFEFDARVDQSQVLLGVGASVQAFAMHGSPNAEGTGRLVYAGLGTAEDLAGAALRDAVVVFDRGSITFREKVSAAQAGGAAAVVIVNHEDDPFQGSLGGLRTTVPVVALDGARRDALMAAVGERVTVTADLRMRRLTSQNVVASAGATCEGYLGAHYDSVPHGSGANDNASGAAVVLEAARANLRPGLCVVAFGAEEVGLFGSQDYVRDGRASGARFLLNVDMAGRLDGPIIVGDDALTEAVLAAVRKAGVDSTLRAGMFPPFASSDHVSFTAAGVPAVTLNSGDDAAIHTAQDTMERIDPAAVAMFLAVVDAAVDALLPRDRP